MKEKQQYKFTALSFVLINIWTLYAFFDYFTDNDLMFHGLGLFFFFWNSIFSCLILGFSLILLRILYFKKNRKHKLRTNFFYIFTGIFNAYVFIIWLICLSLKILLLEIPLTFFMIGNLLISAFIFLDIYYKKDMRTATDVITKDI